MVLLDYMESFYNNLSDKDLITIKNISESVVLKIFLIEKPRKYPKTYLAPNFRM